MRDIKDFLAEINEIKSMVENPNGDLPPKEEPKDDEPQSNDKQVGSSLSKPEAHISNWASTDPRRRFVVSAHKLSECLVSCFDGMLSGMTEGDDKDIVSSFGDMRDSAQKISQQLSNLSRIAQFASDRR